MTGVCPASEGARQAEGRGHVPGRGLASPSGAHAEQGSGFRAGGGEGSPGLTSLLAKSLVTHSALQSSLGSSQQCRGWEGLEPRSGRLKAGQEGEKHLGRGRRVRGEFSLQPRGPRQLPSSLFLGLPQPVIQVVKLRGKGTGRNTLFPCPLA